MAKYGKEYSSPKVSGMGGGVMGHEKKPIKTNAFEAQKRDMGRIRPEPMNNRGYPSKAWDYKY